MFLTVKLEKFCDDHDAVLISPVSSTTECIIQVVSDKLELVPTEGLRGLKTRAMNASTYCNMERKGVEQCHGGLKQEKFLTHTIHRTYLRAIHVSMLTRIQKRLG